MVPTSRDASLVADVAMALQWRCVIVGKRAGVECVDKALAAAIKDVCVCLDRCINTVTSLDRPND